MAQPVQNLDLLVPSHIPIYISNYQSSAEKAQTHTYSLAFAVMSICETLLDIALRSEACAEIIGLLSQTPEEARSLGGDEMLRLFAPVAYWRSAMAGGSDHDRMQTVTSGSMSTMTSWCVKCSNTSILIFFDRLLAIARYTATPSCFLLFE